MMMVISDDDDDSNNDDDEYDDGAFSLVSSRKDGSWCHHNQSPFPATFAEYFPWLSIMMMMTMMKND